MRRRTRWWWLSVAVLLPGLALADARVEARRHFSNGMSLIDRGRYDEGVRELLAAYDIKPHPNVLFNVAKAYEAWGRAADAIDFYRRYLAANPPDADAVREAVARLEATLPKPAPPALPPPEELPAEAPEATARPGVDEATVSRLEAVADRLERALQRAATPPPPAPAPAPVTPLREVDDEASFGVPYEETVVAASRRSQSALEAPASVTIITGDEVRASGLESLPELLRRVPGAEVMALGLSSHDVSFRGFNQRVSNKVLVLIDGRPEYQDYLGLTLWPAIPIAPEEIERIEVIRGPGSAMYGSNAMLGVVNIITRAPGAGAPLEVVGLAGNANLASGRLVASGGQRLKYRVSAGYRQGDKYSRDYAAERPDVASTVVDDALAVRVARGQLTLFHAFDEGASLAASAGVSRLYTEVYAIGLLRNYWLDGVTGYARVDGTVGPLKARFFWNHTSIDSAPQYEPIGQRSLASVISSNVLDGELLFQRAFEVLGTHQVALGVSSRLKRVHWDYLGPLVEELHFAAFLQDEWRIVEPLTLVASYRADRHPLLDGGKPGFAHSPRVSLVYRPFEHHAFRGVFATAFRQPTFLESYVDIRVPVPGVNGASVLTVGDRGLRPEQLVSFELGYRGEAVARGLAWDVAAWWNTVSDLIVLSAVQAIPAADAFDPVSGTFLLGRSAFSNDARTYTARGLEVGLTWNALPGLDLRASGALQQVVPKEDTAGEACGPCSQAPAFKGNAGVVWRSPVKVDVSADVSVVSGTTWVEREPAASEPTVIEALQNPLPAFAVVNARIAWRLWDDRVTLAVVGTQLGGAHREHPFGNLVTRRVFAQLSVMP